MADQPTTIAPRATGVAAARGSEAPVVPPPGPPAAAQLPPSTVPPSTLPPARAHGVRQGRPPKASEALAPRRERRYIKPIAALIAVAIVLFLVVGGGYLASRQLYFLGTNSQGTITVYRGLPYDLPAGIHLYETFYISGVPASEVSADRRKSLLDHHLRSQTDASSLIRSIELGQLNK